MDVPVFSALLVGLGRIGMLYDADLPPGPTLTHARALSTHPGWRLAGGVDPDPGRRDRFTALYGAPAWAGLDGVPPGSCDLIVLATPPEGRLELARACLALRPRMLLLEKPLAADAAEGRAILDACARENVPVFVNYHRRCDPAVRRLKDMIDSGGLTRLRAGRAVCSGGLRHNATHFVDLARCLLGEPAAADITDRPGRTAADADDVDFVLTFGGAAVYFQALPGRAYSHADVEFFFAEGVVRYGDFGSTVSLRPVVADPLYPDYSILDAPRELAAPGDFEQSQRHVAAHLHRALAHGQALYSDGQSALATLELCERIARRWTRSA